ncbi:zinc ribbon domain-containing protein [Streptomyces sp. NPDC005917]|uniref:Zn-ribbon domain-containing OB-fold protein n=1 Tax=unclassified Streptomyces TaxID=2593676 RepID=UPI0033DED7F4
MSRTRVPAVECWFTGEGGGFRLLGTRCAACASVFFPREDVHCRNPGCAGGDLGEVPLSRRGRIWSYTDSGYRPPSPLCAEGEAAKLLREGATAPGGRIPVNASGGLASFGEAVPAQAIAQVCELTWQLRDAAGDRQVAHARVGDHGQSGAVSDTAGR